MPRHPVVLLVGCPRSGTTLFTQWLARSGRFAYPTNLMARFYEAPAVGAWVQRILTDPALRFRDEFDDVGSAFGQEPFRSNLGKTRGVLAPNVFWHFWRRFFPEGPTHALSEDALAQVDGKGFAAELAAIESVFERPVSMKAMWIDWNIPFVSSLLERVVFVNLVRSPFYAVQSVIEARERFCGDRAGWWSFRPPDYDALRALDPIRQVVGQIASIRGGVAEGLASLPPERVLELDYEVFCADPRAAWQGLADRMGRQGFELDTYAGPERFEHRDRRRLSASDSDAVVRAWRERTGETLEP